MNKYFITGKVVPERVNFSLSKISIDVIYESSTGKVPVKVSLSIQMSQVFMTIESSEKITDFFTLKNQLQTTLDLSLDIYGYLYGVGYGSEITSLISEDHQVYIIYGVDIPSLENNKDRPLTYDQIINLFNVYNIHQNQLRLALLNFKLGIRYSADTGFYCYRAVEAIRKIFGEGSSGWEIMHSNLGTDRLWLIKLKKMHADEQRHGGSTFMSGEARTEMLANVQQIIDKALVYLQNKK